MSHGIFLTGWATCSHTKKIKLELLVLFQDEILSLKNKSCVAEKMPYTNVTALRFAYWHSYSNVIMNEWMNEWMKSYFFQQNNVQFVILQLDKL